MGLVRMTLPFVVLFTVLAGGWLAWQLRLVANEQEAHEWLQQQRGVVTFLDAAMTEAEFAAWREREAKVFLRQPFVKFHRRPGYEILWQRLRGKEPAVTAIEIPADLQSGVPRIQRAFPDASIRPKIGRISNPSHRSDQRLSYWSFQREPEHE